MGKRSITLSDEDDDTLRALAALTHMRPSDVLRRLVTQNLRKQRDDAKVEELTRMMGVHRMNEAVEAEHAALVRERKHLRIVS